jgi:hypothetical protein
MTRVLPCVLLICAGAVGRAEGPTLRRGPGQPASRELIAQVLEANSFWLHPPVQKLAYQFTMDWTNREDPWAADVEFTAPDKVLVMPFEGDAYEGVLEGPALVHVRQGVSFYGPLHRLHSDPDDHALLVVDEEKLEGRETWVVHLEPARERSAKGRERLEEQLRRRAGRAAHLYEFVPVEKEVEGARRVVFEINCLREPGPGWPQIRAAHQANPSEIRWGGLIISAVMVETRHGERPDVSLANVPNFRGKSPITQRIRSGMANGGQKVTLGEGEFSVDEELLEKLRAEVSSVGLPMAVGCGMWTVEYGGSQTGGMKVDQLWIEKATGMVLREEVFDRDDVCRAVIEYGDFEDLPGDRYAPRRVLVTLLAREEWDEADIYPWTFDMTFCTLGGVAWLLESLEESDAVNGPGATAKVTYVSVTPTEAGK